MLKVACGRVCSFCGLIRLWFQDDVWGKRRLQQNLNLLTEAARLYAEHWNSPRCQTSQDVWAFTELTRTHLYTSAFLFKSCFLSQVEKDGGHPDCLQLRSGGDVSGLWSCGLDGLFLTRVEGTWCLYRRHPAVLGTGRLCCFIVSNIPCLI